MKRASAFVLALAGWSQTAVGPPLIGCFARDGASFRVAGVRGSFLVTREGPADSVACSERIAFTQSGGTLRWSSPDRTLTGELRAPDRSLVSFDAGGNPVLIWTGELFAWTNAGPEPVPWKPDGEVVALRGSSVFVRSGERLWRVVPDLAAGAETVREPAEGKPGLELNPDWSLAGENEIVHRSGERYVLPEARQQ